jgi:hypothetical protein
MYVTCHPGVSVRYFYAVTREVVRYFRTITRGSAHCFRTVTSVPHFRVIASEVAFGVNFLAISLKTLRCAQQLTNLFMFLYQKGVSSQKMIPPGRTIRHALASRTTTPATVTNHLVRCSRSVIISFHHLPIRCFQSVTSGAPYVPQRSLQYGLARIHGPEGVEGYRL